MAIRAWWGLDLTGGGDGIPDGGEVRVGFGSKGG